MRSLLVSALLLAFTMSVQANCLFKAGDTRYSVGEDGSYSIYREHGLRECSYEWDSDFKKEGGKRYTAFYVKVGSRTIELRDYF